MYEYIPSNFGDSSNDREPGDDRWVIDAAGDMHLIHCNNNVFSWRNGGIWIGDASRARIGELVTVHVDGDGHDFSGTVVH